MAANGWKQLIPSSPCFLGKGKYPLRAYSEFMPPPRLGWKPYGWSKPDLEMFDPDDPWGWYISEFEQVRELEPGLLMIARQVLGKLERLLDNDPSTTIPKLHLQNNPYWPPELAAETTPLAHERRVILLPLALSQTQDDKGRVRWTLFGNSEQGPARAFWKSFYVSPREEWPAGKAINFICRLLQAVYHEKVETAADLHSLGFGVMSAGEPLLDFWAEGPLPSWTQPFLVEERSAVAGLKYLLTFRPFGQLPQEIRRAYLEGRLHLLPFPGSLVFWGTQLYHRLHQQLPFGLQIPLMLTVGRHQGPDGIRLPQDGFLHEPSPKHPEAHSHHGPVRNTYKRTHRWDKVLRDQDELALLDSEDKLLRVLFSSLPDDLRLYDKPMARNVQLWTEAGELLLDGPRANMRTIRQALRVIQKGGMFGYRFLYPAMRVGKHEVYWHRPLVAYRSDVTGEVTLVSDAPLGYLTAYSVDRPRLDKPIELWPRLHRRSVLLSALPLLENGGNGPTTARNIRKLFDACRLYGGPLPRSFARQLLHTAKDLKLEEWLESLAPDSLREEVEALIEPPSKPLAAAESRRVLDRSGRSPNGRTPPSLTYDRTARRSFEVAYWKTIATLAEGRFLNKNNGDCVCDPATQRLLPYHERHLESLGDYLLEYYRKCIAAAGLTGKALAGEIPFQWETDFDYSWMGGWLKNQEGPAERNLLIVIPGRDRSRAIIMADHYDTAYMVDRYDKTYGGCGARLAACGADDNHSATAALMLAAPLYLEMSKAGQLGCDIWLVHLTGEEFPADCLGARALTQRLVEQSLTLHINGGKRPITKDLSNVRVQGVYVSDMIAHNNDRDRDVFQIAPGTGKESLWLAYQAHIANRIWNESVPIWNQRAERRDRPRGRRSPYGAAVPMIAPHLALNGEVRPVTDPRSTLYNTDGQIFSDAGVPVVLFMENYDINRHGYHDTHDTMANIDLDYGSALAAIVIETVARAVTEKPWS